ncbi:MAG: DNA-3-methyladenine glycosylase I [Acidimicrobiia bacterium]|nr:DNA-3-methyladenine glycosylase I [Acidimicrobiia bacterium]
MSAVTDILAPGPDGRPRCWWGVGGGEAYVHYHDEEWGRPVADDRRLFEMLALEGFQAGLSWSTILRKRESFREAFAGFDPQRVAAFGEGAVARLLGDAGIVRHRGKIEAAIGNARAALEVMARFGSLQAYFRPHAQWRVAGPGSIAELVAETTESGALSRDLKRRGFTFVGPTIVYSFMQAVGLVNDHAAGCVVREEAETQRRTVLGGGAG